MEKNVIAIQTVNDSPVVRPTLMASCSDLLAGRAQGPGAGYREYVSRKDVQRMAAVPGRKCLVYEFPWGFITEEYGVWNFYVTAIWRAGTTNFLDRFEPAWHAVAEPALRQAMERNRNQFYMSFDDGVGIYGCISLACVLGSKGQQLAREWLTQEFLPDLWPQMLKQVMDPNYELRRGQSLYC